MCHAFRECSNIKISLLGSGHAPAWFWLWHWLGSAGQPAVSGSMRYRTCDNQPWANLGSQQAVSEIPIAHEKECGAQCSKGVSNVGFPGASVPSTRSQQQPVTNQHVLCTSVVSSCREVPLRNQTYTAAQQAIPAWLSRFSCDQLLTIDRIDEASTDMEASHGSAAKSVGGLDLGVLLQDTLVHNILFRKLFVHLFVDLIVILEVVLSELL